MALRSTNTTVLSSDERAWLTECIMNEASRRRIGTLPQQLRDRPIRDSEEYRITVPRYFTGPMSISESEGYSDLVWGYIKQEYQRFTESAREKG